MKTRLWMTSAIVVGLSVLISFFLISGYFDAKIPESSTESIDDRESLKEVVNSNTACSIHWRTNLWKMWDNNTYDYKNDPIFQECFQWLEFEKYANTRYHTKPEQLDAILEYCIDSKDFGDTKGLSYSNETHYIDTINCEWQDLGMIKNNSKIIEPQNDAADIPGINNDFAINLYMQLSENSSENIFFSPASIFTAFAITFEGAHGDTANELQQFFGFPLDKQDRKNKFQTMLQGFEDSGIMGLVTPEYTLHMANGLWISDRFEPKQEYVETAKTFYHSKVDKVDFVSNKGIHTINDWVKEQTQNKIEKLFEENSTDELTAFIITNAIYFKGEWVHKFTPEFTRLADFHINENQKVRVSMMELDKTHLKYAENDLLQIIQLPYKGSKISMLVLLPKKIDGLQTLEENLNLNNIAEWRSSLEGNIVSVYLPKFTSNTEYDLKEIFQTMGMKIPFDSGRADFRGISDDPLYLDSAIHKAFVSVDEAGTEAAAATGIEGRLESGPPNTFRADHPFIFIIQDDTNGSILFIGRVVNPQ